MDFVLNHDRSYITKKEDIVELIHSNEIKDYKKLPLVKVGDFVTCCRNDESLEPNDKRNDCYVSDWQLGKTFLINNVTVKYGYYYVEGREASGGVYVAGIRYATEDEIKKYKK